MEGRRNVLAGLAGSMAAFSMPCASPAATMSGRKRRTFPPFRLQADRAAFATVTAGVRGYATVPLGRGVVYVWLQDKDGGVWAVGPTSRDLMFKFEVFTLQIESLAALRARFALWTPPKLPRDVPAELRALLGRRPPTPEPPTAFAPWPFATYRCEVLLREDYIADVPAGAEIGGTIGANPVLNGGGRRAPPEATATCEIAAGLLFTGGDGGRLLAAVDWTPGSMVWTTSPERIDAYVADCERVDAARYRTAAG